MAVWDGDWYLVGVVGRSGWIPELPCSWWCWRGPQAGAGQSWLLVTLVRFRRDCYPLWVGNVTSRISKKVLHSSFRR